MPPIENFRKQKRLKLKSRQRRNEERKQKKIIKNKESSPSRANKPYVPSKYHKNVSMNNIYQMYSRLYNYLLG